MIILGIETTCDETSASIVKSQKNGVFVLSNTVSSQVKLHAKWGGVVPNLAAREHVKNIIPVLKKTIREAKIKPNEIDLVSVANGPGLIPALMVGVNAAKTLSYFWKKPLMGIHHIEGHIYANFVRSSSKFKVQNSKLIKFPVLCLVVSGGHTQLVLMKKHLDYKIIGETLDDAAGEAFDKVARILGLGYPGGPAIAQRAMEIQNSCLADKRAKFKISLPRPMINSNNFNFSFSGLKTAVLYETKKNQALLKNKTYIQELCHEFQKAVCDVLIFKTIAAAKKYNPKTIMLAGGVSANLELRKRLGKAIKNNLKNISYQIPSISYTGDNAAMIAAAASFRFTHANSAKEKNKLSKNWANLTADANLKL